MPPKITVIVLNYKRPEDTVGCIQDIYKTDLGNKCDYLIVDNSPNLGSNEYFSKKVPYAKYLPSTRNLGFAGGNNLGVKYALKNKSDYILIVNPDVRVPKSFFSPLLKHFSGKNVGIVAPVTVHRQKNFKVYGLEGHINWAMAKAFHRNTSLLNETKPISSAFVTFACVMISAKTFKKVGFLSELYFMYFEDVDYCLEAKKRGVEIILDPTVVVEHKTSSSFSAPTKKLFISFQSHLKFILKWLKFPKTIRPLLYIFVNYPYLYLLWTYHGLKYKLDE